MDPAHRQPCPTVFALYPCGQACDHYIRHHRSIFHFKQRCARQVCKRTLLFYPGERVRPVALPWCTSTRCNGSNRQRHARLLSSKQNQTSTALNIGLQLRCITTGNDNISLRCAGHIPLTNRIPKRTQRVRCRRGINHSQRNRRWCERNADQIQSIRGEWSSILCQPCRLKCDDTSLVQCQCDRSARSG